MSLDIMREWAGLTGRFIFASSHGYACPRPSLHVLQWSQAGIRVSKSGFLAACQCIDSFPTESALLAGEHRVHVCSNVPCTADWHPSKYGHLPPLVRHGRILRVLVEGEVPDLGRIAAEMPAGTPTLVEHPVSASSACAPTALPEDAASGLAAPVVPPPLPAPRSPPPVP